MSRVLDQAFDNPLQAEERATMPFAGGIMRHGYQCGMIWGATLAAGAEAHRRLGPGPQAEAAAIAAAQRLVESFRAHTGQLNCYEITDLDRSSTTMDQIIYFLVKGGSIGCLRMAAGFAPVAFEAIETALAEEHVEAPSPPVSCAVVLARKMGASEMHAAMAAGLAGGIGLCGGACGALGATIWIIGMKSLDAEGGKVQFESPEAVDTIDRFLKCTDYDFECSEIVGRKFRDLHDHADHLRAGGCSEIIEVLASQRALDAASRRLE